MLGKMLIYIVLIITMVEFIVRFLPEKQMVVDKAKEIKDNAVVNQSKLFYHIIWKNFKQNWKDYLLILICNIILFMITVIAFYMMQIMDGNYEIRKIQFFSGLSEILMNAMIPMGILSMFLIIILVFYYLKMRAKNYGIFLTLGMYKRTLYYVTGLEFGFVFLMSFFIGGVIGKVIVSLLVRGINQTFSMKLSLEEIGIRPYLYSIAAICLILLISFMSARDIFYDFHVGKSEDMRGIAEKFPGKIKYAAILLGVVLCIYSVLQYRKFIQFENEYLLLVLFIGLFLIIRNAIAIYLIRERKDPCYIKKLLVHNQLYHKSKTNAGFITVFTIIQFCILYYFSFQLGSVFIVDDASQMFPYDFVCLADDTDNEFINELLDKYEVEVYQYPMVRVSAYDSTEKKEFGKIQPTQGQHIGISESTYHALKKKLNQDYVKTSLGLDAEGTKIHIVYQQDKSVKAQPVSHYIPRNKALLHIGKPCTSVSIYDLHKRNIGYEKYKVVGREIGSLIGNFRQGVRENIIVFSDKYFNEIKDAWKTMNIRTGEQIVDEELLIPGFIYQGVTKLVLINAMSSDIRSIRQDLDEFEIKHLNEENELYKKITPYGFWTSGIYDSTVSYVYAKHETINSIEVERIMKAIMSSASICLFIIMNFMVLIVKMLSELEINIKRQKFLICMGMPKNERIKLIRNEIIYYYCILPLMLASVFSIIYMMLVFAARFYTIEDIKIYLKLYFPGAVLYITIYFIGTVITTRIYSGKIEKEAVE